MITIENEAILCNRVGSYDKWCCSMGTEATWKLTEHVDLAEDPVPVNVGFIRFYACDACKEYMTSGPMYKSKNKVWTTL